MARARNPKGCLRATAFYSTVYTAELADIVAQHKTILHAFADDSQLYNHCQVEDVQSAAANLEYCVREIEHWMAANRLRLNPEKTELICIGAKNNLLKIPGGGLPLTLGIANCSQTVTDIGMVTIV